MADEKKISDLSNIQNNEDGGIKDEDIFVVVDSSITTGTDAGAGGKTSAINFGDLKTAVGTQGPQGEQGPKGDEGAPGIPGEAGEKGDSGETGVQGAEGAQGATGAQGAEGAQGATGAQGVQGVQGAKGADGQDGDHGTNGTDGERGFQGFQGTQGTQGVRGFQGYQGTQGHQGPKGDTGDAGSPWGGGTFTGNVYYNKPTYLFKENEPGVFWGLRKATNKNLVIDVTNSGGIISASGTQTALDSHRLEIDTTVQVNAGILAIAAKPAQGEQDRLSMDETEWNAFRDQGIEGGQLILGYSGKASATGQVGTWNIDSCPTTYADKHTDALRFFTYDLNNTVSIPVAMSEYGLTVTDSARGQWSHELQRQIPQPALKVQGNGLYQIEFESTDKNHSSGHPKEGEHVRGGIGIDNNGFMRLCGNGDETTIEADGQGGHYSGVGIMAHTKEVARFTQRGIEFNVPVEYKATSGNGTSSDGVKTLQGWINDAIVVDDTAILMEQAGAASTSRHRISAWNINTGLFEKHINPNNDPNFSGTPSNATDLTSDLRPDLIMAETHLHDGTKKNKDEICFYAFTLHSSDFNVRHTYRRSTKEITSYSSLGAQSGGFSNHWKPFAAYAQHEFDNNANRLLINQAGAVGHSVNGANSDEWITIYSLGKNNADATGYTYEAKRYLNIRDIPGFNDVLFWPGSTATNVSAYCSVVSINPWNGRVYIVTGGEINAFHTFQIDPNQKVSGKSWAETFWDELDNSSSTSDGYAYGHGHLQYVSSWKAPLQDTNRYGIAGANGDLEYSISYDYDTEKPKYIAHCSKYNEDHSSYSNHNVQFIPFSEDWM